MDTTLAPYKKRLTSLFKRILALESDRLGKRLLALAIQEELIKRIGRAEYLIRNTRKSSKDIKTILARPGNTREQAQELKTRIAAYEKKTHRQRILINIYRSIGDSIAFIYGDRFDLKQYALKEEAGFITGKRGARLERGMLRRAFAVGATVVLNDLTHTLRHADLTVFRPDLWPEGGSPFFLIEAKSGRGGDKARAKRQQTAAEDIRAYLATDKRQVEGGRYERVSVETAPEYHFEEITRLVSNLPKGGFSFEEIEPGLTYIVFDCAGSRSNIEDALRRTVLKMAQPCLMSVNDMKSVQLAYVPFPLSIRDPDALFRFYNGEIVIYVVLDIARVNERLALSDLKIEITRDDEVCWKVLIGADTSVEGAELSVGGHAIGRIHAEFLGLDWLIRNLIAGPTHVFIERIKAEAQENKADDSVKEDSG